MVEAAAVTAVAAAVSGATSRTDSEDATTGSKEDGVAAAWVVAVALDTVITGVAAAVVTMPVVVAMLKTAEVLLEEDCRHFRAATDRQVAGTTSRHPTGGAAIDPWIRHKTMMSVTGSQMVT